MKSKAVFFSVAPLGSPFKYWGLGTNGWFRDDDGRLLPFQSGGELLEVFFSLILWVPW